PQRSRCRSNPRRPPTRQPSAECAPSSAVAPNSCPRGSTHRAARVPRWSISPHTSCPQSPSRPRITSIAASRRQRFRETPQIQGRERLALVIGNSAYTLAPSLPCCAASANVAAARLRAAGFEVAEHLDASNGATGVALNDFAQAIAAHPRAAAIVYVCFYGVNFRDRDFVLPVSATLTRPSDVLTQGVVARAFGTAAGGPKAGATLVLLDLFA